MPAEDTMESPDVFRGQAGPEVPAAKMTSLAMETPIRVVLHSLEGWFPFALICFILLLV